MNRRQLLRAGLLTAITTAITLPQAQATNAIPAADFQKFGLNPQTPVIIDSLMTFDEAIADHKIPAARLADHQAIRPFLAVQGVFYIGFDAKLHYGQFVCHRELTEDIINAFAKMIDLKFPIEKVIPHSFFNYDDEMAMEHNNSSSYRPGIVAGTTHRSEHFKGAAFDINTRVNPMDVKNDDGSRTITPHGAYYDPTAQGALVKESDVRRFWDTLGYQWGGNWGDPQADPAWQFFKLGYFDYQHFQLGNHKDVTLPPGW